MNRVNFINEMEDEIPRHLTGDGIEFDHDPEQSHLLWDGRKLSFHELNEGQHVSFDFVSKLKYHALQQYSLKKEPLARALGLSKNPETTVLDGTAGTGKDAMLMLSYGARIESMERNPFIYLLLKDALKRLSESELADQYEPNYTIQFGPCQKLNREQCQGKVFFYDPMFPALRNKSKSKKEMELFKNLTGGDEDIESVFLWAKEQPFSKIVFKQSVHDKPLGKPTASFKGKSVQYHMYQL